MEEIFKILESSDIECSSDDDDPDWKLQPPDSESSEEEDVNEQASPVPSASKGPSPSSSRAPKKTMSNISWNKKSKEMDIESISAHGRPFSCELLNGVQGGLQDE